MSNNNEVFKKIAEDLPAVNQYIETAQDLISALKEVGKDTTEQEQTLKGLIREKTKWEQVVKKRV